jgi:hypothetical protein
METIRQQMIVLLTEKEMSARELSQAIGMFLKTASASPVQVAALTANSHTLMSQDI